MIAALIVGGLTAWFFGIRAGVVAAVVAAAALLAAMFVPGLAIGMWVLVIAYCAGLWFLGPKLAGKAGLGAKPGLGSSVAGGVVKSTVDQATSWAKKLFGSDSASK
jgi:hypothetical protein